MARFTRPFTATAADIDELGHVNNAVWVQWIQELAVSHWEAVAPAEHRAAHIWAVTRHAIDYRGNLREGEQVTGETWVAEPPKGARFDRHARFTDEDGKVKFCHTLNNTVIASPRVLIPILELYQNADGTITIPEALRPYMGGRERIG